MIPEFPQFKKIEIEDRKSIEAYTDKYQPYSDFNFTSLWAWDIYGERMVSKLNGNLVVLFTDYKTSKPSFSFLGTNKLETTAREIINFAKKSNVSPILRFISEESANGLKDSGLFIEEDRENFDYIFSISQLSELKGSKFKEKRHSTTKFLREYPEASFELRELSDRNARAQIVSVLHNWRNKKKLDNKIYDSKNEDIAISRLLQTNNSGKLIVSCVFWRNVMIGFSVDEILPHDYAISHFFKADNSHNGVYDFMNKKVSQYLLTQNVKLWNWEQDLGIENLRKSKISYHPVAFLKKYRISLTYKK